MNTKLIKKYLKQLKESVERELVQMMVQAWLFRKEAENPIKMGKEEAQRNLNIYENRIKYLENFLEIYNNYEKEEL